MSLAETQQIMAALQEIMRLLDQVNFKTANLEKDMPKTQKAIASKRELLKLLATLNMTLALMGSRDLNEHIAHLQQAIFFTNALLIASRAFERGTLVGNILGAASVMGAAVSAATMEGY